MTMHIEQACIGPNKNWLIQFAHYDGITDLVNYVDEALDSGRWKEYSAGGRNSDFTNGSFLKTLDATRNCLLYSEPAENVLVLANAFRQQLMSSDAYRLASEKAKSTKRRRVFSIEGGDLDIDRHLGGQDECWSKVTRGLQRPLIRLGMRINALASNDANAYAGIAALAEGCGLLAEQAGCSLEILCLSVSTLTTGPSSDYPYKSDETGFIFPLKQADEPVNTNQILSCGIPGLQRWYRFNTTRNAFKGTFLGQGKPEKTSDFVRNHFNLQHILELGVSQGQQRMFLDDFVKTLHDA